MHSDNHLWLRDQVDGARAQERERQAAIVADLRAKLAAAEGELREARVLLFGLLDNYSPTWHNVMGKVGHECSFCHALIRMSGDFHKTEFHKPGCAYIKGNELRFKALPSRAKG